MEVPKNSMGWPAFVTVPKGLQIQFVSMENPYMQAAFAYAQENTFEDMTVTTSVIVKDGVVLAKGVNGDGYHQREKKCLRTGADKIGKDYNICPGCHEDNHSERVAIREALAHGHDLHGTELYMYGHWWSCEACMTTARDAGITTLYVLADSRPLFDRTMENQKENKTKFIELWNKKLTK